MAKADFDNLKCCLRLRRKLFTSDQNHFENTEDMRLNITKLIHLDNI